jgi:linoleoyl-CoA desaturase
MHFILSIYLSFTFFISHHVSEVDYFDTLPQESIIGSSWIKHQIITTIDFHPENKFANFLFGGFNLHIAHHIFPDVSHVHYPALTRIIRTTLAEHELDWYKSFTFVEGIQSHLRHLKNKSIEIMNNHNSNEGENIDTGSYPTTYSEAV